MSNFEDRVTVKTFGWLQEAELCRGLLESEGLDAHIPEQHSASINILTTAMQVRVQVPVSQLERANEILASLTPAEAPSNQETCPKFGSTDLQTSPARKKNWFRFVLGVLVGVPMRAAHHQQTCRKCGQKT